MEQSLARRAEMVELYAKQMEEFGADEVAAVVERVSAQLDAAIGEMLRSKQDPQRKSREPDDYASILALRPDGPRLRAQIEPEAYKRKLEGALLCRFIGCTLGAPVENWSVERMEAWAAQCGDAFPPQDYWLRSWAPDDRRVYNSSPLHAFTRDGMDGVPADDDVIYTLMGLLIAEQSGLDFTVDDVGRAWMKWLPVACTAEEVALRNLKAGVVATKAADEGNPYVHWIGAAIRSDPWGYLAAGDPERAAKMAYQDACLSHRRNGIYGEMFLAAAQAAAFSVATPEAALGAGLLEIPKDCWLARDLRWALSAPVSDWRHARQLVDERFPNMSPVHTNNNLCLIVFALRLGNLDVTKTLGETVAMGLDNDCTAASVGSILGAIAGPDAIPPHWIENFHNRVDSYLTGIQLFAIDDLIARFDALYSKNV